MVQYLHFFAECFSHFARKTYRHATLFVIIYNDPRKAWSYVCYLFFSLRFKTWHTIHHVSFNPFPLILNALPSINTSGSFWGRFSNFSNTGWCPPVISWFINPSKYSYICHKPQVLWAPPCRGKGLWMSFPTTSIQAYKVLEHDAVVPWDPWDLQERQPVDAHWQRDTRTASQKRGTCGGDVVGVGCVSGWWFGT